MNRVGRFALVLGCCLAACASLRAVAEVGVATSSSTEVPYILAQITDDSDPWGGAWKQIGTDPNREVLNPQGFENGDGMPALLAMGDGRVLVAWSRNSAQGFDLVFSVYVSGEWSAPQVIAGSPEDDELDPALVLAPDGSVHLAYAVFGVESKVVHRLAPADLASWSAEARVSPPGELARRPFAAWDGQTLRIAYEIDDFGLGQTPRSIAVARLEAATFLREVVAVTFWEGELNPRIHRDGGRLWVDWVDAQNEVAWTRLDEQGQWESLRYEPFQGVTHQEFHVRPGLRLSVVLP